MATTAQFTSVRVVCNNTLAISLNQEQGAAVKVPHSTKFDANAVKNALGISVSSWDEFIYQMKILSERKIKHSEAQQFFQNVFNNPEKASYPSANERSITRMYSTIQKKPLTLLPMNALLLRLLACMTETVVALN
jgi:hypothetical protein